MLLTTAKRTHLKAKGWKVGSAAEFLNLSREEAAYAEVKLTLSQNLQEYRKSKKLTRQQVALILKSSQSRIAKMEAGDSTVSLDHLVRSLLALGATRKHLARMLT
jgi:predicted XRE-type DNA-binding protein